MTGDSSNRLLANIAKSLVADNNRTMGGGMALVLKEAHQGVYQGEERNKNQDEPENPGSDKVSANRKELFHSDL